VHSGTAVGVWLWQIEIQGRYIGEEGGQRRSNVMFFLKFNFKNIIHEIVIIYKNILCYLLSRV
jgi:hypothetical protein